MDENMRKRNELLAQTVIKGLKSRNMSGYYAADKEEAVKLAMELIPEGSSIAMGGCMSAQEIGLIQVLEDGNYNYIDRAKLAPREGLLAAYDADIFPAPMPLQTTVLWSTLTEMPTVSPALHRDRKK